MMETFFKPLSNDIFYDNLFIIGPGSPVLHCETRIRFKQSELSGNEWRTSAIWHLMDTNQEWQEIDSYNLNLKTACNMAFSKFYGNQQKLWDVPTIGILFLWKGQILHTSSHSGDILTTKPMPLLVTLGHLPAAWVEATEMGPGKPENWHEYCFQYGCPNEAVSTYQLKELFSRQGERLHPDEQHFTYLRRFCPKHLDRGDSSREDSNDNYIVIDGPGPKEADWEGTIISKPKKVYIDSIDDLPKMLKKLGKQRE